MKKERERERHPQPNPPPNASNNGEDDGNDSRRRRILAKLKASIISKHPSLCVDSSVVVIERRLQGLFRGHDFLTPTHPPYALMIHSAISSARKEEEGGSTMTEEVAISEFIEREYRGLPWAHRSILGVQLRKLREDGEIVLAKDGRYLLRESVETKQQKKKKKKKRNKKMTKNKNKNKKRSKEETEIVQEQPYCKSIEECENEGFSKWIPVTEMVIELPVGHLEASKSCSRRNHDNLILKYESPPEVLRYGKVYRRRKSNVGSKLEHTHKKHVKFKVDIAVEASRN